MLMRAGIQRKYKELNDEGLTHWTVDVPTLTISGAKLSFSSSSPSLTPCWELVLRSGCLTMGRMCLTLHQSQWYSPVMENHHRQVRPS